MFCTKCGVEIENGMQFCPNCGTPAWNRHMAPRGYTQPYFAPQAVGDSYAAVMSYRSYLDGLERAARAWKTIGIIQIIIGVFTIFIGYGIFTIGIGIWNIVQSGKQKNNVAYFRQTSQGIVNFINTSGDGVTALIVNIFIGGIVGIIAAVIDMNAHKMGLANRDTICFVEMNGLI